MAAGTTTGTTVAWGTSTTLNALKVLAVRMPDFAREVIETSNLSTTGSKTFIPADLVDHGSVEIDYQFDPSVDFDTVQGAAAETITIDWGGDGDTSTGPGFITGVSRTAEYGPNLLAMTVTVKCSGAWTHAN